MTEAASADVDDQQDATVPGAVPVARDDVHEAPVAPIRAPEDVRPQAASVAMPERAETPVPPPPPASSARTSNTRGDGGRPAWLLGVVIAVVVIVVVAAGAFAYFKFFRSASGPEVASGTPAASTPAVSQAMASALVSAGTPPASSPVSVQLPSQALTGQANVVESAPQPVVTPQAAPQQPAQPAPVKVDPTLKVAASLVGEGQRAYDRGDYDDAIRHAHSALDVHAGYPDAEKLLQQAQAKQRQIAEAKAAEQRRVAAAKAREQREAVAHAKAVAAAKQAKAKKVAAAAALAKAKAEAAKRSTPDAIYNRRAHSECHRGFFGKSCRHKIRVKVCEGVRPGAPGTTVCKGLRD